MSEENIAYRLKFLLQSLGITSSFFADECGISRATFSQLLTGRNKKISDVLIGQIHTAYPSLSILWLLFNEGPMWIGQPEGYASDSTDDNLGSLIGGASRSIIDKEDSRGKNGSDIGLQNMINPDDDRGVKNNSKENGLNSNDEYVQNHGLESVNNRINSTDNLCEIENLRVKMKKVVQVTIYYDDSTFETLFPRFHGDGSHSNPDTI